MGHLMRLLPLLPLVLTVGVGIGTAYGAPGVVDTRHNLSVSGPGEVKSTNESEVCIFCHGAHTANNSPTLWNRQTTFSVAYQPYQSPTMAASAGQPDGSSRVCLSCHDGTLAIGETEGRRSGLPMIGTAPSGRLRERSPANLSTDLSGSHPVSLAYAESTKPVVGQNTRMRPVPSGLIASSLLDARGKVQCTSCHDPHQDPAAAGARVPPFWRGDTFSVVCVSCHDAPVADAGHANPSKLLDACGSCHVGHGVKGQPLLPRVEEAACYDCHGSKSDQAAAVAGGRLSPTARPGRVDDLFALPYRHPVDETSGVHRPAEDLERAVGRRHVECADCHTTHGPTQFKAEVADKASRVSAFDEPNIESCYRCHGAVGNLPLGQTDKSREFGSGARSAHPVDPSGPRSGQTRSLLAPWLRGDAMTCGDCHGSSWDDDRAGVHGSRYPAILRAAYVVADGATESQDTYALCYHCHSRESVLSNESFEGHSEHVIEAKISCYACHDSHGSAENPSLLRFGKDFRYDAARSSTSGRFEYNEDTGTCYVNCHGVDHDPLGYR